jgi:wyosine [tRNA(Phe)-imidazoG37] synthetase (radical SAM superfamily)
MSSSNNFKYLYGPVHSWRLGNSLGVDLLSQKEKKCNFDCAYCQIGKTVEYCTDRQVFVDTEKILNEIRNIKNKNIDYITLSGRGEPTLAKNLGEVISGIKNLRKEKIAVITNSTLLNDESVKNDLSLSDVVMAKFDACNDDVLKKINNPPSNINFKDILNGLYSFRKIFKGLLKIQVMFTCDNVSLYKEMVPLVEHINPDEVEVNTPLRPSDTKPLDKNKIKEIKKYFMVLEEKKIKVVSVYDKEREKINVVTDRNILIRRGKEV